MENNNIINGNCWIAYFDILGFKNEIRTCTGHLDSFARIQYEDIIDHIDDKLKKQTNFMTQKYDCSWFSDSFLFYTSDDSIHSYQTMHFVATGFFHFMIEKWPLTGALTVGDFYANKVKNIYLGEALIDAHDYAEKQDWIGLVLTPNARTKLETDGHGPSIFAYDFREYDVPIKRKVFANGIKRIELECEKLLAHKYRDDDARRGVIVSWIKPICNGQETEYKRKYENTLKFYDTP